MQSYRRQLPSLAFSRNDLLLLFAESSEFIASGPAVAACIMCDLCQDPFHDHDGSTDDDRAGGELGRARAQRKVMR